MHDELPVRIVAYEDRFANDFAHLNREWLDKHELYEEEDGVQLYSPRQTILEKGGEIYIALQGDQAVGTVALVRTSPSVFELVKLAVADQARGRGLGRQMTELAIARAKERGADRVVLLSSSKLTAAIGLYESIGFKHKALPKEQPYVSADVYMELDTSQRA
ncbi:MAG: putative acetyltransferase [Rhodothermales bacterium]|jgi:putative acetyltransferase